MALYQLILIKMVPTCIVSATFCELQSTLNLHLDRASCSLYVNYSEFLNRSIIFLNDYKQCCSFNVLYYTLSIALLTFNIHDGGLPISQVAPLDQLLPLSLSICRSSIQRLVCL